MTAPPHNPALHAWAAELRASGATVRILPGPEPVLFFTHRVVRDWLREAHDDAERVLAQSPRPVPALARPHAFGG